MDGIEQPGPGGAGTVTAACLVVDGFPTFELVVHAAVLRTLPWYRGGRDVSVVRGVSREINRLRIMHPGPHRLLARPANRLDKLPPVVLRVRDLDWLQPGNRKPEPVEYRVLPGILEITLPAWARAPVPLSAPLVSFGPALAEQGR